MGPPPIRPVRIAVLSCANNPDRITRRSSPTVTETASAPGHLQLRPPPPGLPDPSIAPPVLAESDDPFTMLRVIDLVARLERGRAIRIADLVARLDATYLDWLFPEPVVADALLQLQANWMADYRNASGIVIDVGPYGSTVAIEDSSRVDPWIVRQAERAAAACHERLAAFSRLDRPTGG
jgi:hypothetical protein